VLVFNNDPGAYSYSTLPDAKPNNINRQIQTTLAGLRAATRKYAFKLRSDFVLNGNGFLDDFNLFPKTDPEYRIFEHKILSCVFFARNPRIMFPFHPSDIAFFGLRMDLINLFEVPFMIQEDAVAAHRPDLNIRQCKYTPEQHLWVNCLRKNGKEVHCDHQSDSSPKNTGDTERFMVSNFIHLDYGQFNLIAPKRLRSFAADNVFHDVVTHIEWQRLYKQYLDNSLIVPDKDPMRDLINPKSRKFELCKTVARLCTMFLIGKRLKNFRRKIREKILQFLTSRIYLPE
jgi:hypothetical protein